MVRREFAPQQPRVILSPFCYQVLEAIFDMTDLTQATLGGIAEYLCRDEAAVALELELLEKRGLVLKDPKTEAFAPTSAAAPYKIVPCKVRRGLWPWRRFVGWTIPR